jgi:type II secretory pathway component GspD/PulD (secretin)
VRKLTWALVMIVSISICSIISAEALVTQSSPKPAYQSVQVYYLRYILASPPVPAIKALVPGAAVFAVSDHTLVVKVATAAQQGIVARYIAQFDRPQYGSFSPRHVRLSYVALIPAVVQNIVAIVKADYPQVVVTEDDSSSSLVFDGPEGSVKAAYALSNVLLNNKTVVANARLDTRAYTVHYAVPYGIPTAGSTPSTTAGDMVVAVTALLQSPYPDLKANLGPGNNLVMLQGSKRSISAATNLLGQMDVLPKQVELQVTIYGLEANKLLDTGFDLPSQEISTSLSEYFPPVTAPAGSASVPSPAPIPAFSVPGKPIRSPLSLIAQIDLLSSEGEGTVLSNPKVIVLSGHAATLVAGQTIPFAGILSTTSGPASFQVNSSTSTQLGTTLTVVPVVNDANRSVTLFLNPQFTTFVDFTPQGLPETVTRSAQTTINVPDGMAVVITGLDQLSESDAQGYLPPFHGHWFLSDLFHQRFNNKDRLDVVIVVKPCVMDAQAACDLNRANLPDFSDLSDKFGPPLITYNPRTWNPTYPSVFGIQLQSTTEDVIRRFGKATASTPEDAASVSDRRAQVGEATTAGTVWKYHPTINGIKILLSLIIVKDRVVDIKLSGAGEDSYGSAIGGLPVPHGASFENDQATADFGLFVRSHYVVDCCQPTSITSIEMSVPQDPVDSVTLSPSSGTGMSVTTAIAPQNVSALEMIRFERAYLDLTSCDGHGWWNVDSPTPSSITLSGVTYGTWTATCSTEEDHSTELYFRQPSTTK